MKLYSELDYMKPKDIIMKIIRNTCINQAVQD